jgi:DsbC/DsbD-like thiol-disulfide interchange protein
MHYLAVLAILALGTAPAAAAATAWQELAPDTRARMISSDALGADGSTLVGIEIDMPADTKTYWRVPGETGIPTTIDLDGSTGIADHRMLWPHPEIDQGGGYTDFVYFGPTVLPVELALAGDTAILQASVVMGICSEICVPVRASFTLPLNFSTPDPGQALRLGQAAALAPVDWPDPRQPLGDVAFDAATRSLSVPLNDPNVDPLSLIADAGPAGPAFGAPQKSPDGRLVLLPLLGDSGNRGLEGRTIQLTFTTGMGAFALTRRVAPSTPDGL